MTPLAMFSVARGRPSLAIAGLVLIRQRPGSANGVVFVTVEDEKLKTHVQFGDGVAFLQKDVPSEQLQAELWQIGAVARTDGHRVRAQRVPGQTDVGGVDQLAAGNRIVVAIG